MEIDSELGLFSLQCPKSESDIRFVDTFRTILRSKLFERECFY